ncbi:MAG: GDSL-type esterase/lipase family protein [Acidobacteriaceae bacterium]|nr:GDSL-type esterase/lipase family protein [Acidobacteriaceae bacterium]
MFKGITRWALMIAIAGAMVAPAILHAQASSQKTVRISILGDSIDADEPPARPIQGWGTYLQSKLANAQVTNLALSGRSTKTFLLGDMDKEGKERGLPKNWIKAQATPADYWIIKFGGNDSHPATQDKHTDPDTDYTANLKTMIVTARKLGIQPILVTPPDRPKWKVTPTANEAYSIEPYAKAMRRLAKEENVPLIEMFDYSHELYTSLGPNLKNYVPPELGGHLNRDGANMVAQWMAGQLVKIVPQLKLAAAPEVTK